MKWPQFNVYDFFFILTYFILNFYLLYDWKTFQCHNPLNVWLLLDYILLLFTRVIFVLKSSGYTERARKALNAALYIVVLPVLVVWCVLGAIWQAYELECIPEDMVPWSFLLWLGVSVLSSVGMVVNLIYEIVQMRKLNKYLQKMDSSTASINSSLVYHSLPSK